MTADKLVRFLLASVVNNLATVALYQGLLFAFSPTVSFVMAYAAGLLMVVFLYPQHVFRVAEPTRRDKLAILLVYLASFAVGLLIVRLMDGTELLARLSIFVVLISNFVINFGVTSLVLGGPRRTGMSPESGP